MVLLIGYFGGILIAVYLMPVLCKLLNQSNINITTLLLLCNLLACCCISGVYSLAAFVVPGLAAAFLLFHVCRPALLCKKVLEAEGRADGKVVVDAPAPAPWCAYGWAPGSRCKSVDGANVKISYAGAGAEGQDVTLVLGSPSIGAAYAVEELSQWKGTSVIAELPGAAIANQLIAKHALRDTFYIYHLNNVRKLYKTWTDCMPRVQPWYAVKCNPDPGIVHTLASLGAGFDCASKEEIALVLRMGVAPSRIIFANPCKKPEDLEFAAQSGVRLVTFDTVEELRKMAPLASMLECVLRLRYDDPTATFQLGEKYGAPREYTTGLLQGAKDLGLEVVGVSFHIGSGSANHQIHGQAIQSAKEVFLEAEALGFKMRLLDVGGGFTGRWDENGCVQYLDTVASVLNTALTNHFGEAYARVQVIAEPGRYFAETSATICAMVIGSRSGRNPGSEVQREYWISDGIYGSFLDSILCKLSPQIEVLRSPLLEPVAKGQEHTENCSVWGPTCCCLDLVAQNIELPQLRMGDWLVFPNAGAYTAALATGFNGMGVARAPRFYFG